MNIVLITFCDSSNIGDQLIVDCLVEDLSFFGAVSVLDYSLNDKGNTAIKSKNNTLVKQLYHRYFRHLYFIDWLHGVYNKYYVYKKLNWKNLERKLKENDIIILGGGNILFGLTQYTDTAYKIEKIVSFVKKKNKKVYILSGGVGPFLNEKQVKEAKKILIKLDGGTVRDFASLRYAKQNDLINIGFDPVLFYPKKENIRKVDNVLSICIMDIRLNKNTEAEYKKYIHDMAKIVKNLAKRKIYENIFLFSSEPRDYNAVWDVYELTRDIEEVKIKNIENKTDLFDLYSRTKIVLGTRMHSMILAFSQEIPVVGISWQPKVVSFFKTINQEDAVFDILSLSYNINSICDAVSFKNENYQNEVDLIIETKNKLNVEYKRTYKFLEQINESI